VLAALLACSEYSVKPPPAEPVDTVDHTGVVDSTPPPPEHTGTTEPPPEHTGEPTEPPAEAPVYANTTDELFEIDPLTGARTSVGTFSYGGQPVDGMVDIAIDLAGRMYGGTFDALYRIDPTDATLTKVCDTDLEPYALAFTSDGVLFAGAGTDIVEVNLGNCARSALTTTTTYTTSGDLVGLPDGWLYWTVRGSGDDELVRVDPDDGRTQWVGRIDAARLFGLGYDDGVLFGFSADGAIVGIDPANASTTPMVSDGTSWWGATTNPVQW
jgi:hypothetical protein